MSRAFSTRELARMWSVSESTIKRWADAGTLPCERTPGGHRRFRLEQIQGFQHEHGFKATGLLKMRQWEEPDPSTAESDIPPESKRRAVFRAAQNNRRTLVLEYLEKLYLRGLTLYELYDHLVVPLEKQLRDGLESGELSLGQSQVIRNNLEDSLHRLFAEAVWRPSDGSLGLCGALDRRRPLILNGIVRALEAEGWECLNIGAGIDFEDLVEMVRQEPVNIICLVSSQKPELKASATRELAHITDAYQIPLLLFGAGFDKASCESFQEALRCPDFSTLRRHLISVNRR